MRSCLEQWFSEAEISCNFYEVHCKNPEKDKQFNAFMNDTGLSICLSVAMLSEGIHCIDGVILLRDTISPNLYYQQIGRVFAVDMDTVPIIFDLVANCESIMDCSLKNDLLNAIDKRNKDKKSDANDRKKDVGNGNCNDNDKKEITKDDIESFFVFDQVVDAVNAFKEIEERIVGDDWSEEDEDLMRQYYPSMGVKVKPMLSVERSDVAIQNRAKIMGLVCKSRWQEEEKIFLRKNYGRLSNKEIAEKIGRTEKSVRSIANKLKLNNIYRHWDDEETEILKRYYPIEGKKVANRLPYKNEKQCLNKARELNLKHMGNKTSKYKYVIWDKRRNKWVIRFLLNGKNKYFGLFQDEDEAGKVAMQKAREYGKI